MRLLEQYNDALRTTEDVSITQLNRILDASFNRLIRRTRVQIRTPRPAVDRNLSLLQEFRELVPAFRPDRVDGYDRVLRSLMRSAQGNGIAVAHDLTEIVRPGRPRIDVSIHLMRPWPQQRRPRAISAATAKALPPQPPRPSPKPSQRDVPPTTS